MHTIDYEVKQPGLHSITLNFNSDWGGDVFIAWHDAEPPSGELFPSQNDVDARMRWLREHQHECTVVGRDLLRGRAYPTTQGGIATVTVPFMVLTIATWLAINRWWQDKVVAATEDTYAGGYR